MSPSLARSLETESVQLVLRLTIVMPPSLVPLQMTKLVLNVISLIILTPTRKLVTNVFAKTAVLSYSGLIICLVWMTTSNVVMLATPIISMTLLDIVLSVLRTRTTTVHMFTAPLELNSFVRIVQLVIMCLPPAGAPPVQAVTCKSLIKLAHVQLIKIPCAMPVVSTQGVELRMSWAVVMPQSLTFLA